MHHVKLSAMPCFLMETGWRCRKKLVNTTTIRLRRSVGAGWRKIDFQICELKMMSPRAVHMLIGRYEKSLGKWLLNLLLTDSNLHKAPGVLPRPHLLLERAALVHLELPIVGHVDRIPFERTRGGA